MIRKCLEPWGDKVGHIAVWKQINCLFLMLHGELPKLCGFRRQAHTKVGELIRIDGTARKNRTLQSLTLHLFIVCGEHAIHWNGTQSYSCTSFSLHLHMVFPSLCLAHTLLCTRRNFPPSSSLSSAKMHLLRTTAPQLNVNSRVFVFFCVKAGFACSGTHSIVCVYSSSTPDYVTSGFSMKKKTETGTSETVSINSRANGSTFLCQRPEMLECVFLQKFDKTISRFAENRIVQRTSQHKCIQTLTKGSGE